MALHPFVASRPPVADVSVLPPRSPGASRWRWPGLLLCGGLGVLAACGGGQAEAPPPQVVAPQPPPPMPVHKRGKNKLIAEVGPAGGTLELQEGARVDIPAGALAEDVSMTFAEGARTTAFDNREHEKTLGRTLELAPQLAVATPVVVSIPLPSLPEGYEPEHLTLATEVLAEEQREYQDHGVMTRWDYMQAKHADGRVKAELQYVPGMRLQFLVSRPE